MALLNSPDTLPLTSALAIAGKSVTVETVIKEQIETGCQCAQITAKCGDVVFSEPHVFAPNPDSTLADVQAALNSAQQRVAREAAGRDNIKNLVSQLK